MYVGVAPVASAVGRLLCPAVGALVAPLQRWQLRRREERFGYGRSALVGRTATSADAVVVAGARGKRVRW